MLEFKESINYSSMSLTKLAHVFLFLKSYSYQQILYCSIKSISAINS